MKNFLRSLIAIWYLLGWILHVYLGIWDPEVYQAFGNTALIPGFAQFWGDFVMSRITSLALLLALFEIAVGLLLIHKNRWVHLGLWLSLTFNLFLVQLGLSFPADNLSGDIYFNRLPNLFFVLIQIYLLFQSYPRSIPEMIREGDWTDSSGG